MKPTGMRIKMPIYDPPLEEAEIKSETHYNLLHENDPGYDHEPQEVPAKLSQYYNYLVRNKKTGDPMLLPPGATKWQQDWFFAQPRGFWAYVCPCCKMIYAPGWGGMPGSFRVHIEEYEQTGGCVFKPKPPRGLNKNPKLDRFSS